MTKCNYCQKEYEELALHVRECPEFASGTFDHVPITYEPERYINYNESPKWNDRFMRMAQEVASWSKDPSSQVGAVAVNNKRAMFAEGFNGFPRRIADLKERYEDRELKYKYVLHAEQNLISNACSNGTSLAGSHIYVWGIPPCSTCALQLIQADISCIIVNDDDITRIFNTKLTWFTSWQLSYDLFREAGVKIVILPIK